MSCSIKNCVRSALACALLTPANLGLRQYRVFVVKIEYDGNRPGLGTRTRTDTELLISDGYPPVDCISSKEVFLSGGLLSEHDLKITVVPPYTKNDVTYGTSNLIFDPDMTDSNIQIYFLLYSEDNPNGLYYKLKKIEYETLITYIYITATGDIPG